jgi:cytochrome c peroxidase
MQRQCRRRPHARRSTWVWIGTALALGSAIIALLLGTSVIAASSDPSSPNPVTLGEKLFADASLSASGAMSCATCHDPAHAHAQSNDLPVQLGGPNLDVPGFRAVPSLQYISLMPAFAIAADGTPSGGFDRDGRAKDLLVQALRPLFAAHEMANATPADLVARLTRTPYADEFRQVFGERISTMSRARCSP